jgi:hypothetical protein
MMLAILARFALTLIRVLPKLARLNICNRSAVCQGAAICTANLSSITIYAFVWIVYVLLMLAWWAFFTMG